MIKIEISLQTLKHRAFLERNRMKKIFRFVSGYLRHTDILMILLCFFSSLLSVLALAAIAYSGYIDTNSSIPYRTALVQAAATAAGAAGMLILSEFDYHTLAKLWRFHLPVCLILVLLTFFVGITVGDADDKAWLPLPLGMSLQPAEFLKISVTLTFASHLVLVGSEINDLRNVLFLVLHAGSVILLVHFQGDDGTALIFACMFLCMALVAGLWLRYFAIASAVLLAAAPVVWLYVMNDQQRMRILALYTTSIDSTDILFQQNHSVMAIGSGQVLGTGLFRGEHHYVPVISSDFIFAFLGEATGFLGCLIVISLLLGICARLLWTSHIADDDLGRYICVGVFSMIAVQTIVNLGMNLKILPVVGVTLPFFSAGGSSVLGTYLGIGLALSVYMHSRRRLFSN